MICERCKQSIEEKLVFLDKLGRRFDVCSVLMYMKPFYGIIGNGVTVTTTEPVGYNPVIIIPDNIECDGVRWVLYAREYDSPMGDVTLDGYCGQRDSRLYKIADNVGAIP